MNAIQKIAIICCLFVSILLVENPGWAAVSIYGANGYNFIPQAEFAGNGQFRASFSNKPRDFDYLNLFPYSLRLNYSFKDHWELGFSNTLYFLGNDYHTLRDSYNLSGNIGLPIIPSIKYCFISDSFEHGSFALGFAWPIGGYFVFDILLTPFSWMQTTITTVLATAYDYYTGMSGVHLKFGLPFSFRLEGSYTGSTEIVTESNEAFISAGFDFNLSRSVLVNLATRLDRKKVKTLNFGLTVQTDG